jgi:hypothetical protein
MRCNGGIGMKRKLLLVLGLLFATFALSNAQPVDPEMARQSTEILKNIRKVELLNQILPLALQPAQIQQILPAIEKIRVRQKEQLVKEHKLLLDFQKTSATAVDAGVKGKLPSTDLVREIDALYKATEIGRQVIMGENLDLLMPVITKALDKGQQKVMANSLRIQFFEPDVTGAQASDDQKMRVFCREVLLDPLAYELLVTMAK